MEHRLDAHLPLGGREPVVG